MTATRQTTADDVLKEALEAAVLAVGCSLVGYVTLPSGRGKTLRVYIEKEPQLSMMPDPQDAVEGTQVTQEVVAKGVTLDDCTHAARQIKATLEVENLLQGDYRIEVSSPGLDRPLFTLADFQRFIGSVIKLKLYQPHDGQRNFKGVLLSANEDMVQIEVDKEKIELAFTEIEKTNLVPNF